MQRTNSRTRGASGEKEGFRPDIEGLRGIAVLLVVVFHAGLLSTAGTQLPGGFIGVDLFFVISGFLITGLLIREREQKGRISFSRFYARRVRRILPAAAVCLLITIPLAFQLVTLIERPSTMQDGAASALSFANVRFALTTDYFHPVNYSPFLHFWSLGVEEQFYFVWPALLAVVAWRRTRLGAGIALAGIVAGSFLLSLSWTHDNPTWAFYMLPTRAWQLAAGGLLAVGAGSLDRLPRSLKGGLSQLLVITGWLALAALFIDAFVLDSASVPYPGMAAAVPTAAGVLLIASGTERHGPGALLSLAPIRFIGKISYSLYLWHWPMLILGGLYLGGPLRQPLEPVQAYALALFSIPLATVSWGLVEEPFRRGYIPLPRPSRTVAVGLSVMAIVAVMGGGFQISAQNTLASLGGPIAQVDPTEEPDITPDANATPTPVPTQASLAPGETPTPTPAMTPALTFPPPASPPETYAVTNALRPTLANAPDDYEKPWKDNCLGWERTLTPSTSSKCIYGDKNGTYTVALVGDSHASALFPAINELAKAHGWKLVIYMKIDCSFVDIPIINFTSKQEYTECATWNQNIVAKMNASPPDLIIVHMSRWIYNLNSEDAGYGAHGRAMAREMEKLPAASRVVMITDIPDPWTFSVPECLSSYLSDYRRCNYARTVAFNSYYGKREAIASEGAGVPLIDLAGAICPGSGVCPVVTDGMIMFRDQHHLTATYAASLGPEIDRQLVPLLNAPPGPSPTPAPSPSG
jgi:peptidoglycan/LPS O-acetylase OafA/YrhL